MTRARLAPAALAWLRAEVAYIAERDPAAARKLLARMEAARERLADFPRIAPAGQIPGTRRLVVRPYVLTLRQRGGAVEIIAIRHARQSDAGGEDKGD